MYGHRAVYTARLQSQTWSRLDIYARYDHLVHSAKDTFRALPPSQGALKQHILRSAFVAGHLWGKADEPNPILPDVTEWGLCYSDNEDLIPVWTLQHDDTVYKACKKKCNCGEKNNCLTFRFNVGLN